MIAMILLVIVIVIGIVIVIVIAIVIVIVIVIVIGPVMRHVASLRTLVVQPGTQGPSTSSRRVSDFS